MSVAIIGGGIAGLVCGARLKQLGFHDVWVYDTGKNGPGGRCSTREIEFNGKVYKFDHGVQYFTVSTDAIGPFVLALHEGKAAKLWQGAVGHLDAKSTFTPDHTQHFIGTYGAHSIPRYLSTLVHVKCPVWVQNVTWDEATAKWKVDNAGNFDFLVIAHNGKCAERLMENAGSPEVHRLLSVRFSNTVDGHYDRMNLSSLWVLMVGFRGSVNLPYVGAHVTNPTISWIGNNNSKYPEMPQDLECWTVISTRDFGASHKVPQEHIPQKMCDDVTHRMLTAFYDSTGIPQRDHMVAFTKLQLWGSAVPISIMDTKGREFVFDSWRHLGVCGDWLSSPCVEGAASSGLRLAEALATYRNGHPLETPLTPRFLPAPGTDIGAFPINPKMIFHTLPPSPVQQWGPLRM